MSVTARARLPIRLTDGAVAIGGRPVLRDIDLEVPAGQFLALMGANGSGKSTLVRALIGLRPLTAGTLDAVRYADRAVPRLVADRLRARSAAAPTSGVPASVWEVVASGRLTHRRLFRPLSRADRAAIAEALEVVGLGRPRAATGSPPSPAASSSGC